MVIRCEWRMENGKWLKHEKGGMKYQVLIWWKLMIINQLLPICKKVSLLTFRVVCLLSFALLLFGIWHLVFSVGVLHKRFEFSGLVIKSASDYKSKIKLNLLILSFVSCPVDSQLSVVSCQFFNDGSNLKSILISIIDQV